MSIYSGVFPACMAPHKQQMEDLFNTIDQNLITSKVKEDFGLELDGTFGGQWKIGASLAKARKNFADFYKSIPVADKLHFQIGFLNSGVQYVKDILQNITEDTGIDFSIQEHKLIDSNQEVLKKLIAANLMFI